MVGKSFDSSMSMRLFPIIFALLFTGLVSVSLFGCQTDVGLDERRFQCQANSDCLGGYACDQNEGVCTPVGLATDASDGLSDSSVDTGSDTDAEELDAHSDTDGSTDTADASDTSDTRDTSSQVCSSYDDCPVDEDCIHGECIDVSEPCNVDRESFYVNRCGTLQPDWGHASAIDSISFPEPTDEECCFDFDGEAGIDNALVELLTADGSTISSINTQLSDGYALGGWTAAVEFPRFQDGSDSYFYGFGWHHLPVANVTTSIEVAQSDAIEGTFSKYFFPSVTMTPDTRLVAKDGTFFVPIPLFGIAMEFLVHRARLEADVVVDDSPRGLHLTSGKLGGAISVESIVRKLNTYADEECDCVTGTNDPGFIDWPQGASSGSCRSGLDATNCSGVCLDVVDNCSAVVNLLNSSGDVDVSGDGRDDAMSFGAHFEAEAMSIDGTYP